MALETVTHIADLVAANPAANDPKSQGDDHIRNIKSALKTDFPAIAGAVSASHVELSYVMGVTSPIQAQINAKASAAGQTWSGTHDFSGTVLRVPTRSPGDNATYAASTAYVDAGIAAAVFSGALPSQTGNAGKVIITNGTTASWGSYTPALANTATALATPRNINGVAFDGTANITVVDAAAVPLVGTDEIVTRAMFKDCGQVFLDKGSSGTAPQTLDYTAGQHQRITVTGAFTLSTINWPPSGNLGEMLLELTNGGTAFITWPTVGWVKTDGSTTTNFSLNGVTLQTSGTDWVLLWSRDGGATIYGKIMR